MSALLRYTLSTSNEDFCSEMCMTGFYNDVALGGMAIARTSQDVQLASVCLRECKKCKEEVEEKGLKLSITGNGKEGKSKMIASCGYLEEKLQECSKEEGVTVADSVETLGGLEDQSQEVTSKRKSKKKELQGEILAHRKE